MELSSKKSDEFVNKKIEPTPVIVNNNNIELSKADKLASPSIKVTNNCPKVKT